MHLVDRHRRVQGIDGSRGRGGSCSAFSSTTIEAVCGRTSAAKATGSDLSGSIFPIAADDLVFVFAAGLGAGDEDFPETVATHTHGVAAPVPEIEIADDADPLGIGSEDRKGNAGYAIEHHRMGAELVIEAKMGAFAEQKEVEVGQTGGNR